MRSKLLIYTCVLLSIAALSACDAKSTDAESDTSVTADVARADSQSAAQASPQDEAAEEGTPAERPSASSPNGAKVAIEPPLDIATLLTAEDLSALATTDLSTEKLAGTAATPTYNSARFYPADSALYGVGLQVWKFEDDAAALAFVTQMRAQYLGVKDAPADAPTGGARGFISARGGIDNYIFAPENAAHHVLAISCSADFCANGWADLKGLASTVGARVAGDK